eukprot:Selendium_serpulae@DN4864_c0_g2_i3.p1
MGESSRTMSETPPVSLLTVIEPFAKVSDTAPNDNDETVVCLKKNVTDALHCVDQILGHNEVVKRMTVVLDDAEFVLGCSGENEYHLWKRIAAQDANSVNQEQAVDEAQPSMRQV